MIPVGVIFTDLVEQQFCVVLLIVLFFFSKTVGKLTTVGQVRRGRQVLPKSDSCELLMF